MYQAKAPLVFIGNNGDVTKAYYQFLERRGPAGELAVSLFRAQKRSSAAKRYRRGYYKRAAYDVKNWSLAEICRILKQHATELHVTWGWKHDPNTPNYEWILYVDLDGFGQCSFHTAERLDGPDYPGKWQKQFASVDTVIAFCSHVETLPEFPQKNLDIFTCA